MQCTFYNNVSHIVHFDFFHCTSKVGTNVHQMQFSDRSHVHFLVMYMRCTCECNFLVADIPEAVEATVRVTHDLSLRISLRHWCAGC
jgi:hypothetical protein